MSAIANIVLPDSQATPVNHTFTPVQLSGLIAKYQNFAGSTPDSQESLTLSMNLGKTVRKVVVNIRVPRVITESINGIDVDSVPDYAVAKLELLVPPTWVMEDVEDLAEMASQALSNTQVVAACSRGEFVY
jgi:hypothetical protein